MAREIELANQIDRNSDSHGKKRDESVLRHASVEKRHGDQADVTGGRALFQAVTRGRMPTRHAPK